VLTNYETSWYASNREVKEMVENGKLGEIKKVMVNSGHQGPEEIGVSPEFLEILTDPEKNGAGALFDFGCYGANLMTWLLNGERPVSVTAVLQQNKPEIYPEVDDEATIILQYESSQCVIQGSWNWTFSRKDMEVYGEKGYAIAEDANTVRQRLEEEGAEEVSRLNPTGDLHDDPFKFLAAVVRGDFVPDENNLYGLPVNLIVMEILEAARISAEESRTVFLEK
jgi:predicted dehydrogenase